MKQQQLRDPHFAKHVERLEISVSNDEASPVVVALRRYLRAARNRIQQVRD